MRWPHRLAEFLLGDMTGQEIVEVAIVVIVANAAFWSWFLTQ